MQVQLQWQHASTAYANPTRDMQLQAAQFGDLHAITDTVPQHVTIIVALALALALALAVALAVAIALAVAATGSAAAAAKIAAAGAVITLTVKIEQVNELPRAISSSGAWYLTSIGWLGSFSVSLGRQAAQSTYTVGTCSALLACSCKLLITPTHTQSTSQNQGDSGNSATFEFVQYMPHALFC